MGTQGPMYGWLAARGNTSEYEASPATTPAKRTAAGHAGADVWVACGSGQYLGVRGIARHRARGGGLRRVTQAPMYGRLAARGNTSEYEVSPAVAPAGEDRGCSRRGWSMGGWRHRGNTSEYEVSPRATGRTNRFIREPMRSPARRRRVRQSDVVRLGTCSTAETQRTAAIRMRAAEAPKQPQRPRGERRVRPPPRSSRGRFFRLLNPEFPLSASLRVSAVMFLRGEQALPQ